MKNQTLNCLSRRHFILGAVSAGVLSNAPPIFSANRQVWRSGKDLPIKVQEIYPVVHKSRLYVAGGIAKKLALPYFTQSCFSYDLNADQWQTEADLPHAIHHASLVSTQDRLFLVGGFAGSYTNIWRMSALVLELVDDSWVQVGELPKPQAEGVLTYSPEGFVHLVTGQSPKGAENSARDDHREVTNHLLWRPGANRWESLAPIPTARNSATGGWIGDQLIVVGGRTSEGNLADTEIYDLNEDRWRRARPLPLPQAGTASVMLDDGMIVFGGEIFVPEAGVFANVWRYSLARDEWLALPDLPTPRHGLGAGKIGDAAIVVGGATEPSGKGTSARTEILDLTMIN
ncbi:MAG: kelch repeat-containing protein [Pseudomonadota bacterium]